MILSIFTNNKGDHRNHNRNHVPNGTTAQLLEQIFGQFKTLHGIEQNISLLASPPNFSQESSLL